MDLDLPSQLGRSAGRSRGNPTGRGAATRATARQRAYEVPPPGQHVLLHDRGDGTYRVPPDLDGVAVAMILALPALLLFLAGVAIGYWVL